MDSLFLVAAEEGGVGGLLLLKTIIKSITDMVIPMFSTKRSLKTFSRTV